MNNDLDDWLRRAGATRRLAMERALAPHEITPAQFVALEYLQHEPGLSGADIARLERLTAPTTSVILSNLERKGLVARKPRAAGGRAQHLELTSAGLQKFADASAAVTNERKRLVKNVDSAFGAALVVWLRKIADNEH
jgi:DNA-binding MarR family transcriptional regulator